jgi:hypothetical protein
MRRTGIAGVLAGGAAIACAALFALAPGSAVRPPVPEWTTAPSPEPSLAEAIALLGAEIPPLPREYAPPTIDVPFQPIPEPGTGALVALGLALRPRLARSRAACHPAR